MNPRSTSRLALLVIFVIATSFIAGAQQLNVAIDATKTGAPISPYMYGFFTELLSNWYEAGLWAEMLGDRKFFYPVTSSEEQTPPNSRRFAGKWHPVGPDSVVTMDAQDAFVGEHSPRIQLDAAMPHGIQQAGLGLIKGKAYTGRIIISVDGDAKLQVSLVWGLNPGDRQTVTLSGVRREYTKLPLRFTVGADTTDARLEITGTGSGSFHIGAVSLMPADNINGFRADMIAALKEIGPTMFRWPGGNFTSGYDWRDGIGDPDRRSPRYDYAWKALESNDVGTDEFMQLTKILGLEPYICVNAGFGDARSAAEQVEYMNGAASTPMGKLRAANGHPEPYHVKWWNIGNEMYGPWQLGHMSLAHYVIKHNMFARAMREVDPNIRIVASGATVCETSTTGSAARSLTPGKPVAEFGGPADWTGGLLANSASYLDAIAEHLYPKGNQAFDAQQGKFVPVDDSIVDRERRLPNRVKCAVEAWQEYQKRFPNLNMSSIPIALDEWVPGSPGPGRGRPEMYTALSSAEALHELFRYSGMFVMSEYTSASGLLAYNKVAVNIRPIGLMFEMYRRHFGTIPVEISGNSPQHEVLGTVFVDKPRVSSGSDTYPLDVQSAFTQDHKALTVAIVNPSEAGQELNLTFKGVSLKSEGRMWRIAGNSLESGNPAGEARQVNIVESAVSGIPDKLSVPKFSISIYEFPVQ